jgi:hypothetical protein
MGHAEQITAAGEPAQLDIRPAGEHRIRVALAPRASSIGIRTTANHKSIWDALA